MSIGLPVSRVVNVQVNFTPILAQQTPINTLLLLGSSAVIDTVTRMRSYGNLAGVAADFGTLAPEYLAAAIWFAQSPQPTQLFIGRWVSANSKGQLIDGALAAANLLVSAWTPFTSAAFLVYVDGAPRVVSGVNLSGVTNLNGVASAIQTALVAAGATGATVVYNANYSRFEFTSGTTGTASSVGFLQSPTATGSATFAGNVANNDTLTINGTLITFVTGAPVGSQVQIGATLAATLQNLVSFLNSSVDVNLSLMTYLVTGSVLYIQSKATGTTGNSYTLAKVSTNIAVSGATLAGGVSVVNDISGMLAGTALSSGAYTAPGLVAETLLSAVTLFDNQFSNQWYGLFAIGAADSDHQSLAAYCEAANPPHYYFVNSQAAGTLVSNDTSSISYVLQQLKYNKSMVQYSSTSLYAGVSYAARILTTAWLGQNTTITEMYKSEPGVLAETLNSNQANAIQAKNANVYVNYNNATSFIEYGTSASGQFTDTVIGADWLAGNIQNQVFNALYGTPYKVPQTDKGMTVLLNAAEAACVDGLNNGFLGAGQWNAAGFGGLNQGDFLDKGFYVWAPAMATQSQSVRQTRAAPVMQIAAKTAGAIHTSSIILNIQQ